ncbi:hypothetical protein [Paraburkholderia caffeinilytica]|uniref:hypothetical protein n=1 Tax=Paraburkholderia caffeinilytica TaxID=1761016 RepID=UPI0038BC5D0E
MTEKLTFARLVIAEQHGSGTVDSDLIALLLDVSLACSRISDSVSRGLLQELPADLARQNIQRVSRERLHTDTADFSVRVDELTRCLVRIAAEDRDKVRPIPRRSPQGRYLLVVDRIDRSPDIGIGVSAGIIFSVLHCPENMPEPKTHDVVEPGHQQMAAGYARYDPPAMLVLKTAGGINGFTLDTDSGQYVLTHPNARFGWADTGSGSPLRG